MLITPQIFDEAVSRTRLKPRAISIARMVILEGTTAAEAGRQHDVSREYARQKVARVMREMRNVGGIPSDWEFVSGFVSPDAADRVRAMLR